MSITIQPAILTPANDTSMPSANWANVNGAAVLRAVGLSGEPWGEIDHKDLDDLIARVDHLMLGGPNGRLRAPMLRADEEGVGERGCRFMSFGATDESVLRRLGQLADVLVWARDNRCGVSWG